jgi:putative transposase
MDLAILTQRSALYEAARAKNPLRWKRSTRNWRRIDIVHLNPDQPDTHGANDTLNLIQHKKAA